jgi:hypothetical protein
MMYAEVIPTATTDTRFEVPLYTVPEAARALGVPVTTFAAWARGDVRHGPEGRAIQADPIVTTVPDHGGPTVPFVGLAEGMVLAAVRRAGVPLQRIRPALAVLSDEIGVAHALATTAVGAGVRDRSSASRHQRCCSRSTRRAPCARRDRGGHRQLEAVERGRGQGRLRIPSSQARRGLSPSVTRPTCTAQIPVQWHAAELQEPSKRELPALLNGRTRPPVGLSVS